MKQIWERILDLFPGKKADTARYVLLAVAAGILFLWSGDLFGLVNVRPAAPLAASAPATAPVTQDELTRWEQTQAQELMAFLARIQGAGKVDVAVSLESGPAVDVVKDITTEKTKQTETAADNSTRLTETTSVRESHLLQKGGASDSPVVAKRTRPVIAGVVVVAEGAWNAEVKAKLLQATYVKLGIPASRVQVFAAGRGGQ